MRKFILTLSFIISANPIFAQNSSTQKKNYIIEIAPETSKTLSIISKDFKSDIYENICSDLNKNSSIEMAEKINDCPTPTNGKQTIGTIYSCVCENNGEIHNKIKPIIEFTDLSGETLNQFETIQNFYNALDTITLTTKMKSQIEKTISANEENERLKKEAEKKADEAKKQQILNDFANKLKTLLKEEQSLRAELSNNLPRDLKNHTTTEITNAVSKSNGNIETAVNKYIEKLTKDYKDKTSTEVDNLLNKSKNIEETITEENIAKLKNQKKSNELEKRRAEVEALRKQYNSDFKDEPVFKDGYKFQTANNQSIKSATSVEELNTIEEELKKKYNDIVNKSIEDAITELKTLKQQEADKIAEITKTSKPQITNGNDKTSTENLNKDLKALTIQPDIVFELHNYIEDNKDVNTINNLKSEIAKAKNNMPKFDTVKKDIEEKTKILNKLKECTNNIGGVTKRIDLTNELNDGIPPGYIYLKQSSQSWNCASPSSPVFEINRGATFNCATTKFLFPITQAELNNFSENVCKTCSNPKVMTIIEAQQKQEICENNLKNLQELEKILNNCGNKKDVVIGRIKERKYNSIQSIRSYCELQSYKCEGIENFTLPASITTIAGAKKECERLQAEEKKTQQVEKLITNLSKLCPIFKRFNKTCEGKSYDGIFYNCYIQQNQDKRYNKSYKTAANIYYEDYGNLNSLERLVDETSEIRNDISDTEVLEKIKKENNCHDGKVKFDYLDMLNVLKTAKEGHAYGNKGNKK